MKRNAVKAVRLSPLGDEAQYNEVVRWLDKWGLLAITGFPYLAVATFGQPYSDEVDFGDWIIFNPGTGDLLVVSDEEFSARGR